MARATDRHRENLVHTAMRLFRRQGYAGTGLQQILSESGAPKGSLYHYFPGGKEALAESATIYAGELVSKMLEDSFSRTRSGGAFATKVCNTYAQWMTESRFGSGCPIATTMLECAPSSTAITRAGRFAFGHWTEIAGRAFARDGRSPANARQRAETFIASVEGALILARVSESTKPLRHVAQMFTENT